MNPSIPASLASAIILWGCCCHRDCAPYPATADSMKPASCVPGTSNYLTVTPIAQKAPFWCWAASGEMLMSYLGAAISQCVQATDALGVGGRACPCEECGAGSAECNVGGWPQFCNYGFEAWTTDFHALSFEALKSQLGPKTAGCLETPIAFSWRYDGFGGHMMVANGFGTKDGTDFVYVIDPLVDGELGCKPNVSIMTYEMYDAIPGEYIHWNDYYAVYRTTT